MAMEQEADTFYPRQEGPSLPSGHESPFRSRSPLRSFSDEAVDALLREDLTQLPPCVNGPLLQGFLGPDTAASSDTDTTEPLSDVEAVSPASSTGDLTDSDQVYDRSDPGVLYARMFYPNGPSWYLFSPWLSLTLHNPQAILVNRPISAHSKVTHWVSFQKWPAFGILT